MNLPNYESERKDTKKWAVENVTEYNRMIFFDEMVIPKGAKFFFVRPRRNSSLKLSNGHIFRCVFLNSRENGDENAYIHHSIWYHPQYRRQD